MLESETLIPSASAASGRSQSCLDQIIYSMCDPRSNLSKSTEAFDIEARAQRKKGNARLDALIDNAADECQTEQADCRRQQDELVARTKSFAQSLAMFVPGVPGVVASAALGALDQVRPDDTMEHQLIDMELGVAGGICSKVACSAVLKSGMSAPWQGVTLGIGSRIIDSGLRRQTYTDPIDRHFDLQQGLAKTAADSFSAPMLEADLATGFVAGRILGSKAFGGRLAASNAIIKNAAVGSIYGAAGGASQEIASEQSAHQTLDLYKVSTNALYSAISGGTAAALGSSMRFKEWHTINGGKGNCPADQRIDILPPNGPEPSYPKKAAEFVARKSAPHTVTNLFELPGPTGRPYLIEATPDHAADAPAKQFFRPSVKERVPALHAELANTFARWGGSLYGNHMGELMHRFESRALAQGVSNTSLEQSYLCIARMLDAKMTTDKRQTNLIVAEQMLEQAADPRKVFQGRYGTCSTASLEHRMYTVNPLHPIRLVSEVARTGSFVTRDGTKIILHPDTFKMDINALNPYVDDARSFASQLFQTTASNIHWQTMYVPYSKESQLPRGFIRYEIGPQSTRDLSSERLVDYTENPPRTFDTKPGMPAASLEHIARQITGRVEPWFVLGRTIPNSKMLHEILTARQDADAYPLIASVHTSHPPFMTEGRRAAGKIGGWHSISVDSYNPRLYLAYVHNTWGRDRHNEILTLDDLRNASHPPAAVKHSLDDCEPLNAQ